MKIVLLLLIFYEFVGWCDKIQHLKVPKQPVIKNNVNINFKIHHDNAIHPYYGADPEEARKLALVEEEIYNEH